jgi:hypothetical protein
VNVGILNGIPISEERTNPFSSPPPAVLLALVHLVEILSVPAYGTRPFARGSSAEVVGVVPERNQIGLELQCLFYKGFNLAIQILQLIDQRYEFFPKSLKLSY